MASGPEAELRHVMLVAGESSGDQLGARLMQALRSQAADLGLAPPRFSGVGGPAMEAEGLHSLFPMRELSIMGLLEVLPKVPQLRRRLAQTADLARRGQPDLLVTIDAPAFNLRLARRLRGVSFPVVQYVAPQVWAWRQGRAEEVAQSFDHLLALLPFEAAFFEKWGLPTTFVGHSVLEGGATSGDGPGFRARHGIAPDAPLLALLPGSRRSELSRLATPFGAAAGLLARELSGLKIVLPTVPHLLDEVQTRVATWPVSPILVRTVAEKWDAFAAADMALAASGSVSLELAMSGTPMVIAYRVNPVTAMIARRLIRVPYACMVNIIAERPVVPELLQQDCRPDRLAAAVLALHRDPQARLAQQQAAELVRTRLGGDEAVVPSQRAAAALRAVFNTGRRARASALPGGVRERPSK